MLRIRDIVTGGELEAVKLKLEVRYTVIAQSHRLAASEYWS